MLRVLDLFSGIGGFSLGLERTGGFQTVAFCEIDPFCRRVLAKHWPNVPIFEDVRELTAPTLQQRGIAVDVICGGFPCQDVSLAGTRDGLESERSGLWTEYARLIGELRPQYAIVENTPGLLSLGMARVLGDLAALWYDAEWDCISASQLGADHRRERLWIVAYPAEIRRSGKRSRLDPELAIQLSGFWSSETTPQERWDIQRWLSEARADGDGLYAASEFYRVDDGLSAELDRLGAIGNAVVPQIPQLLGNMILTAAEGAPVADEEVSKTRRRAWDTRRKKYGPKGHNGSYAR